MIATKTAAILDLTIEKSVKTVLLIDDDEMSVIGFKELLELEGYHVVYTSSPFAIPFLLGRHDPDLILIDLSMPALSGSTLLGELRSRVFKTNAPLLLFSGRCASELSQLCEQLGTNDFISKGDAIDIALNRVHFWAHSRVTTGATNGDAS
jgi:FOG: CheY-like receiver